MVIHVAIWSVAPVFSQDVFPEKFEGCITDHFALESDTAIARHDVAEFVQQMKNWLGEQVAASPRGTLKLQIIVNLDGSSCLLSVENSTNVKTRKMKLKEFVDQHVKWTPPSEKLAALVVLEFTKFGIGYRRMGMNGKKGWHYLK
jgi:hypothetical protein